MDHKNMDIQFKPVKKHVLNILILLYKMVMDRQDGVLVIMNYVK